MTLPAPRPPAPALLGAFALTGELLGRGGFADVWAAQHVATNLPVAIKQPRAEAIARLGEGLALEAQALARLQHPGVVRILDVLPEDCIVMERARTTAAAHPPQRWAALQTLLLSALDALAHVHGHGLLHRDIKPSNLLLGCRREPREPLLTPTDGFRLADFGIAIQNLDAPQWPMAGSPAFQPPEQQRGDWNAFGPWTDLYALGRVAQVLSADMDATPVGFADWIRWLIADRPQDRPDRSVEAALALLSLGAPSVPTPEPSTPPVLEGTTLAHLEPLVRAPAAQRPPPTRNGGTRRLPEDWRIGVPWWPAIELLDAGAGLQHLREPRIVGQEALRDRLWAAVHAVARQQTPQTISLRGPRGIGRRALARWLAARAHAVGAVEVERINARHRWVVDGPPTAPIHVAPHERVRLLVGLDTASVPAIQAVMTRATGPVLAVLARGTVGEQWPVSPLPSTAMRQLIRDNLPLVPGLIDHLIVRSDGIPGVVLRRLRTWSREKKLIPTAEGFTHVDGERPIVRPQTADGPHAAVYARLDAHDPEGAWELFTAKPHAWTTAAVVAGFDILDALGASDDDPRRLKLEVGREMSFGVSQPGRWARMTALSRRTRRAGAMRLHDNIELSMALWENTHGDPPAALERMAAVRARAEARDDRSILCEAFLLSVSPYNFLGRHAEALDAARRALALTETFPRRRPNTLRMQAVALRGAGRIAEAIESCRAGLNALAPDQTTIRQHLLRVLADLLTDDGNEDEAIVVYEDAITHAIEAGFTEGEAMNRNNLGWLFLRLGRLEEAEVHLRTAVDRYLKSDRSDRIARVGLAVVSALNGQLAATRAMLSPVEAWPPNIKPSLILIEQLLVGWCAATSDQQDAWPASLVTQLETTADTVSIHHALVRELLQATRAVGWNVQTHALERWQARNAHARSPDGRPTTPDESNTPRDVRD